MSEFLVRRLRDGCVGDKSAGWWQVSEHLTDSLCNEAASEIERLTAELKRVQELHTGLMKNADDKYDALTAELAAAKKDSRRLDYMQKTCLAADFDYGERHECVLVFRLPEHIAIGVNVRKNIDAALTDTPAWEDCKHEWVESLTDNDCKEGHDEVICRVCDCPGERTISTGEVYWPVT